MPLYDVAHAKARLHELVRIAMVGEDVVITRDSKPLVKLKPVTTEGRQARQPGSGKALIRAIAADFEAPLQDFSAGVADSLS